MCIHTRQTFKNFTDQYQKFMCVNFYVSTYYLRDLNKKIYILFNLSISHAL
jgi:hypothetical protein